jgi:alpha-glucosidase
MGDISNGFQTICGAVLIRVEALREDVLRVRIGRDGVLPEDASWAVVAAVRAARATVEPLAGGLGFRTDALTVRLETEPFRLWIEDHDGRPVCVDAPDGGLELHGARFCLRKAIGAGERFFGLGDKAGPLDRRGKAFALWNSDAYGFQESTDPLYKAIPYVLGVAPDGRSWGLLLDNSWRTAFDFGRADETVLAIGAPDGPIDYYVLGGPTPKDVVEAYAWLTGTPPLPPRWALGFQQSRWGYETADEVRAVARRLRAEAIPADALYLDIAYQDRFRPFTTDPVAFPDLPGLIAELGEMGLRTVMITDLHIAAAPDQGYGPYDSGTAGDHFVRTADGQTYVGPVWPGASVFPEFTRAETRDWWGGLYADFQAAGAAGFWNDMNEPAIFFTPSKTMPTEVRHRIEAPGFEPRAATHAEIHNVFGMLNSRATFEGLRTLAPDRRPFVLTRASSAGGQRFAATWTGDNLSTWNHLRLSVPMLLNLGLSGFVLSGADVGGFVGAPSPELLTRWFQVGAFTPLFRDHSARATPGQEPWVHGPEHTALRRQAIEERYRLLPYLYALADEAARTGLPLMRPVFLEFPQTLAETVDPGASFLLGPSLLVAPPLFGEMAEGWDVQLPGPGWYDYWTGQVVAAAISRADPTGIEREVVREEPVLARLPVYVRPGTVLPRQPLTRTAAETPQGRLELRVYPGDGGAAGALYWDDGISLAHERGAFLRQTVACSGGPGDLTVTFDARAGDYPPWWDGLALEVYGWTRPGAQATLDGRPVAAQVDPARGVVRVSLPDQPGPAVLRIV